MNQNLYRMFGVGIPLITAVVLFGFMVTPDENLFSTGITAGILMGLANLFLAWSIYKNRI